MSRQLLLPLRNAVVFLDWHGTISPDLFWESILSNPKHQLYCPLRAETERLFSEHRDLIMRWMRGSVDSATIVQQLQVRLGRRYKPDFLLRRLFEDCRRMAIRPSFVPFIRTISQYAYVVIATDNMDCFFSQITSHPDIRGLVDDVLCSSDVKLLKSDGVQWFFEPWLTAYRLTFRDAILIDDCAETCRLFSNAGGIAVVYEADDAAVFHHVTRTLIDRINKTSPGSS